MEHTGRITIILLPGARDFLQQEGQEVIVDIHHESVEIVILCEEDELCRSNNPEDRNNALRRGGVLAASKWACVALLCIIGMLTFALWAARAPDQGFTEGPVPPAVFPLGPIVTGLLERSTTLVLETTFIGLSPHQHQRLLSNSSTGSHPSNASARLWRGSLFVAATLPRVTELCELVLRRNVFNTASPASIPKPSITAQRFMEEACRLAQADLEQAQQAWLQSGQNTKELAVRMVKRAAEMGSALAGTAAAAVLDDPALNIASIATKSLCSKSALPPTDSFFHPVYNTQSATKSAATSLADLQIAVSLWLHGITSYSSFLRHQEDLRCMLPSWVFSWCQVGPQHIASIYRLLAELGGLHDRMVIAGRQADVAAHHADNMVADWEQLCYNLPLVFNGSVQAERTRQSSKTPIAVAAATHWVFEPAHAIAQTINLAASQKEHSIQQLLTYEWDLLQEDLAHFS